MAVASLLLCSTVSLYTASGPLSVSLLPRGSCVLCCPYNLREDVSFLLYTRRNARQPQRLFLNDLRKLKTSFLRPHHPTVIYIHGFTEQSTGRSSQTIKSAFLTRGDMNVLLVDWAPLAAAPWYHRAAQAAPLVGSYLASFVRFLHRHAVPVQHLHVIGFSLGAEVAAFAGKELKDTPLPRITGLDPAYPGYMMGGYHCRLAPSDALLVDVIHTDGGVLGFSRPLGHVDFYPNGGLPFQPGCRLRELLRRRQLKYYLACSHNRAWALFAESILDPLAFPAIRCHSLAAFHSGRCVSNHNHTQYMGLAVNPRQHGKFYLRTRDRAPFSLVISGKTPTK